MLFLGWGPSQRPRLPAISATQGPISVTSSIPQPQPAATPHAVSHLASFAGGNALSDFRLGSLLPRLQALEPRILRVRARYVHLVSTPKALQARRTLICRLFTAHSAIAFRQMGFTPFLSWPP